MKFKSTISLLIILVSNICFSQNTNEFREAFTLQLAVDSTTYYKEEVAKAKYFVKDNVLQIYPDDHLFIETEIKNDKIIAMKVVKENKNPSRTIELEFTQNVNGRKSEGMTLIVSNPFSKSLIYNAMMYIVGKDQWIKTSIIPIQPKLQNYEMWNETIISLALDNWRLE